MPCTFSPQARHQSVITSLTVVVIVVVVTYKRRIHSTYQSQVKSSQSTRQEHDTKVNKLHILFAVP
jgi:hypothetical protein